MTTGHSPSAGDYDATTALSRFASPRDLERIAETRPDLHSILATNPSIPPRVREILEQSDDVPLGTPLGTPGGIAVCSSAGWADDCIEGAEYPRAAGCGATGCAA